MRTTVTLDEDVLDRARAVINEALRTGLKHLEKPTKRRPYRTKPHAMGLRMGYSLDNVQKLLAQAEGADFR